MLRLLPHPNLAATTAGTGVTVPANALVYTMLRHGRGLAHAEAARIVRLADAVTALRPAPAEGFGDGPLTAA
jgi:hypothetical protein